MLCFYLSPRLLMRSALSQSRPACQHVMADLWAKGKTAASSRGFLKNANPSQCEAPPSVCLPSVSMRTSPARLDMGTSLAFTQAALPPTPNPHLPFTSLLYFFLKTRQTEDQYLFFCLKDVAVLRVWCLKCDLIWRVKGSTWRTKPAVLKRGIQH